MWEHLSGALPTEMIFYLLRSIGSEYLIRDSFPDSRPILSYPRLNRLEIIVKWLQVSVGECYRQTFQINNPICVQGFGSERPSDLYDRFQGELLELKEALPHRRLRRLQPERITS